MALRWYASSCVQSGEMLEERVQQRENRQRAKRTKTNQSESPEWP